MLRGEHSWNFPAGQIDDLDRRHDPGTVFATIQSELREEVGYQLSPSAEITPLGYYFTSQGYSDEHIYLFLASPVEPLAAGNDPDSGERILGTRIVTPGDLRVMIASGEICDSLTLALFARLTARGIL